MSAGRAAALAIAQLGVAGFFIAGVTRPQLGDSAPWFVFAATLLAAFARSLEIESWALLIPGGFVGRSVEAFGPRAAGPARALALVERVLLGTLAVVVAGHYVASVAATAIGGSRFTGFVRPEDLATIVAIAIVGVVWIRSRLGRDVSRERVTQAVWTGLAILMMAVALGVVTLLRHGAALLPITVPAVPAVTGWLPLDAAFALLLGFALCLPVVGGGDVLARAALELPPPRVHALRRSALLTFLFAALVTTLGTYLVVRLIPVSEQPLWLNAPLVGLAQHVAAPAVVRLLLAIGVAAAALAVRG
jgi:hypothetical protein